MGEANVETNWFYPYQLGGKVGSKIEDLVNELYNKEIEVEQKALKRAVNAAYQLQHISYAVDESDKDAYAKIHLLVQKRQPNSESNASSSEVWQRLYIPIYHKMLALKILLCCPF